MSPACPQCSKRPGLAKGDGVLVPSEGRLDQSGSQYLPTVVWTCTTKYCEFKKWDAPQSGTKSMPYEWAAEEVAAKPKPS